MSDANSELNVIFKNVDKFINVQMPAFLDRKSRGLGQLMQKEIKHRIDSGPIPVTQTGNLRDRTHFSLKGGKSETDLIIYNTAKYAGWLEFGWEYPKGSNHGPYPYVTPAVRKVIDAEIKKWKL